jgi:hypothetical protein
VRERMRERMQYCIVLYCIALCSIILNYNVSY